MKLRLRSFLQEITDIHKYYLLLERPYQILIMAKIINLVSNKKKTKKKGKAHSKLVFNKKFIKKYTPEQKKTLEDKLTKIDKMRLASQSLNIKKLIFNFNKPLTRKSLM